LPYIAPEVLRGENYSTASDIYSFGIIMNTLASGQRPWYDRAHDIILAKGICPELMQQCWDGDPTASYLYKKLGWINLIRDNPNPFDDDYSISEEKREKRRKLISDLPKTYTHPEIHPEAYYTSILLYFPELSNGFFQFDSYSFFLSSF